MRHGNRDVTPASIEYIPGDRIQLFSYIVVKWLMILFDIHRLASTYLEPERYEYKIEEGE